MQMEQITLLALAVNAALCASVPASVKQKAPILWAVLDAIALNVGHASNGVEKAKPWQTGVAAAVVGAVLSIAASAKSPVEAPKAPQAMLLPSIAAPAVVEAATASSTTVAEDATVASDATAVAQ